MSLNAAVNSKSENDSGTTVHQLRKLRLTIRRQIRKVCSNIYFHIQKHCLRIIKWQDCWNCIMTSMSVFYTESRQGAPTYRCALFTDDKQSSANAIRLALTSRKWKNSIICYYKYYDLLMCFNPKYIYWIFHQSLKFLMFLVEIRDLVECKQKSGLHAPYTSYFVPCTKDYLNLYHMIRSKKYTIQLITLEWHLLLPFNKRRNHNIP